MRSLFRNWNLTAYFCGNKENLLALISAHFIVKVHLDLQYELQLLVGHKCGQRAVDFLTRIHGLPVVLVLQVHFVAARCFLVVMPPAGAFLCRQRRQEWAHDHHADSIQINLLRAKWDAYCWSAPAEPHRWRLPPGRTHCHNETSPLL